MSNGRMTPLLTTFHLRCSATENVLHRDALCETALNDLHIVWDRWRYRNLAVKI